MALKSRPTSLVSGVLITHRWESALVQHTGESLPGVWSRPVTGSTMELVSKLSGSELSSDVSSPSHAATSTFEATTTSPTLKRVR
eukprot:CAMPEP_0194486526 /NCGR_PEP_ID=MMETSP0253-20130528/7137_1 /TAXON_ID=2966 /ORGANISM="Noctiluca scintillans" /LENGTH=84 /DNA_ID=CAMNT_0039326621 /DNA_START=737 /DNA_END=991 /DNA_ORIENTATION=+